MFFKNTNLMVRSADSGNNFVGIIAGDLQGNTLEPYL